jgi:SAM-dependent methyltransferase
LSPYEAILAPVPSPSQRRDWEDLSLLDPYWAILSDPTRRFGGWDREAFLQSGKEAIEAIMRDAEYFGVPRARGDALDFGCGVGRLTLALADHFERCVGLDISAQMIERARALGPSNCCFAVHDAHDLAGVPNHSFDLVVSRLVLQHLPAGRHKTRYIGEFVRVLRPGGLLYFQLPSHIPARHRVQIRPRLYRLLRRGGVPLGLLYHRLHLHPIRMSFLAKARVLSVIEQAGGRLLVVRDERIAGGAISSEYFVTVDDRIPTAGDDHIRAAS